MTKPDDGLSGCGCWLLMLVANLLFGGIAFQYVLKACFYKDIPWHWDMIGGLFLGELAMPLAVLAWILSHIAGIAVPFIK